MELPFNGHCNSLFWGEDRGTNAPWQISVSCAHRVTVQQRPEIRARILCLWRDGWSPVCGMRGGTCAIAERWYQRLGHTVMMKCPCCRVNKSRGEGGTEGKEAHHEIWSKECAATSGGLLSYSLLRGRPESLLPEEQAREGQVYALGSRITVLQLSQLGKVNNFPFCKGSRGEEPSSWMPLLVAGPGQRSCSWGRLFKGWSRDHYFCRVYVVSILLSGLVMPALP